MTTLGVWSSLAKGWVQVGKAFLSIAVKSIRTVKSEISKFTRDFVLDPLARRKHEEARARAEKRQSEIDEEMVSIYEQARRDEWTESLPRIIHQPKVYRCRQMQEGLSEVVHSVVRQQYLRGACRKTGFGVDAGQ